MTKHIAYLIPLILMLGACSESNSPSQARTDANSETSGKYSVGKHYVPVNEVLDKDPEQNLITEFFWYECIPCEAVEPFLDNWQRNARPGLVFKQSPIAGDERATFHAKLYYIAKDMPDFEKLHRRLFKEVIALKDEQDLGVQKKKLAKVFAEYGMSEENFFNQLSAFKVEAQVKKATRAMTASGLTQTPAIMVNNKYMIKNQNLSSPNEVINVAAFIFDENK
ncbi:MAG: hypothetical protein COA42_04775 [Alteromonadaceae bacterium]|nr:MAG: hypothetical protein COA42_04775 [Alteromonadaceae bacterium]